VAPLVRDEILGMSTNIRQAAIGDEALLAGLNRFVQELHIAGRPEHFKPTQSEELARWYRSLLEQPATRIWIAEEDGLPVGYLLALVHEAPENPFARARRWCEIDQLAVEPSRRKRGIARALILSVISAAKAEGILDIEAASWSFNDGAHEVFRRLGFVPKTTRFEVKSRG
jgi:GNAT superfamily N-acetyltransferase